MLRSLLLAVASVVACTAHAEIILDDFTDPIQIILPAMENVLVETSGVGDLDARRSLQILTFDTNPYGYSDINRTTPSVWTTEITRQVPTNAIPVISFGGTYDFATPQDFTQEAQNSFIAVDFLRFTGPSFTSSPRFLSLSVLDGNDSFQAFVNTTGLFSDSAYTVMVPFTAFAFRGGGGGQADFTSVERFGIGIGLINGNDSLDQGWHVEIDTIRVVSNVPEPGTATVIAICVVAELSSRGYRTIGRQT